jgi:hypothetical protein
MRAITVYYNNGDHVTTSINGTDSEIYAYYLGKEFNLGDGAGGDLMARALCVDFVTKPMDERRKDALKHVMKMMIDNDHSPKTDHPWIPGADCVALKNYLESVMAGMEDELPPISMSELDRLLPKGSLSARQ